MSQTKGHRIVITLPKKLYERLREEKAATGVSISGQATAALIKNLKCVDREKMPY